MKLATFLRDGTESWGFVLPDPVTGADRLVEPARVERALESGILPTSGFAASRPRFRGDWPEELTGLLALGDPGLAELERLASFLRRYLTQTDAALIGEVSHATDDVELLAPVPRPRLHWGLVTNAPSFARNALGLRHLNLMPLGHHRPQGSVIGDGAPVLMKNRHHVPLMSFNVELGVVIGRGGRYIALEDAMDHVAGYTAVTDVAGTYYYGIVPGNRDAGYRLPPGYDDWLYQATASWGGKIADTMSPMGPYLVTKDEVGNPYDLLVYTRQDGRQRDRAHTSATLLGIERVIHWYSSFATLHPGDVIHFGTMGVDGLPVPAEVLESRTTTLESEIEAVGRLRNPVRVVPDGEAVPATEHPSYAIRRAAQEPPLDAGDWSPDRARHVFTAFGNHEGAVAEGLPRLAVPRFLTAPASSLGADGSTIELPPRVTELEIGIELALVIGRLTADAGPDADAAILGFCPLLSVCDLSFREDAVEPLRPAEWHIPAVYGRWADGFSVMPARLARAERSWRDLVMEVTVGDDAATASTAEYLATPDELVATISAMTTLFPGDVVTLGGTSARVRVTPGREPLAIAGAIAGIGRVAATLVRRD